MTDDAKNPYRSPFVFEIPAAAVDPQDAPRPSIDISSAQQRLRSRGDSARDAARRTGARGRAASTAQRMAMLRAWEFEKIPMLRRRAQAEVFFAVWALSGREHDATFTAKAVLGQARISERAARLALRMLLEEGWIHQYGNGNGDADARLRPYVGTSKLKEVLVEYEARIAATF